MTGPLMAIHTERTWRRPEVIPGVFFSAEEEENVLLLMEQTDEPYKVLTGYVEWGKGQLDADVRQGIWRIVPATAERVSPTATTCGSGSRSRPFRCSSSTCLIPSTLA